MTADAVRRNGQHDRAYAVPKLSGQDSVRQDDREAVTRPGDFVVRDARPAVIETRPAAPASATRRSSPPPWACR